MLAKQCYGGGEVTWGEGSEGPHEAGWLALEIAKAQHVLGSRRAGRCRRPCSAR